MNVAAQPRASASLVVHSAPKSLGFTFARNSAASASAVVLSALPKGEVNSASAFEEKLRNLASSGSSTVRALASRSATEFWISSFDRRTMRLGGGAHCAGSNGGLGLGLFGLFGLWGLWGLFGFPGSLGFDPKLDPGGSTSCPVHPA